MAIFFIINKSIVGVIYSLIYQFLYFLCIYLCISLFWQLVILHIYYLSNLIYFYYFLKMILDIDILAAFVFHMATLFFF